MRSRSVAVLTAALAFLGIANAGVPAAQEAVVDVVRFPFPQDEGFLTPYSFEVGYPLVTLIYDTIMWRDAAGIPRPWLARSVEFGEGGSVLTIRLRPGIRWHDGAPLTSSDVAFTFEFVSEHFHPRFTPQLADVEEVVEIDPGTVVIRLKRRSAGFLDQPLADLPILPRHLWENIPDHRLAPAGLPVGSGPYRLVERRPGESYRFASNDRYFFGPPTVDSIQVPLLNDPEQAFNAFQRRGVDMMPVTPPSRFAERLEELSISVARGPSYLGTVLMFNLRQPPFDSRAARRAVGAALDLDRMVDEVGEAVPAEMGYLHPQSLWASDRVLHRFDPDAARARLGRLDLAPIEILAPDNDPTRQEAGRQVVLALTRAGIESELSVVSRDELGRAVGEDAPDSTAPSFQAAIWAAPPLASYDPSFLLRVFGSDPAEAPFNYSGYTSGRFEDVVDEMAAAPQPALRRKLAIRAQKVLARDLPVVPLFYPDGAFAYRPTIYDGWVFVKGTGILDKLSFLSRGREVARPERPPRTDSRREEAAGRGTDFNLLQLIVLALVAIVILVSVAEVVRRRR